MNAKATAAKNKMQAMLDARDTDSLFSDLRVLEGQKVNGGTNEQRIVGAMIADTIEHRHGLGDAMEAIYMDENWYGTYLQALELAYVAVVKD